MVCDSVEYLVNTEESIFDAEHFFDGTKTIQNSFLRTKRLQLPEPNA